MKTRSVLTLAFAAAGVLLLAGAADGRPTTAEESYTVSIARSHLGRLGVPVPAGIAVVVMDTPIECGGSPHPACADPLTGEIVISEEVAAGSVCVSRAFRAPGRRSARFDACGEDGAQAIWVALHEVVHIVRFQLATPGTPSWDAFWEEGLADAVAADQFGPLQYRFTRWETWSADPGYFAEATAVRVASARAVHAGWRTAAARRWRLNQIAVEVTAP